MKKTLLKRFFLIAGAMCVAASLPVRADVIYNNSQNDSSLRFNPGLLQVGDEIVLAGTARYLTNFSFEFWGLNTNSVSSYSGTPQAEVRFYQQNGVPFNGYATPGTLIYDSGIFPLGPFPTARSTMNFNAGIDFPVGGLLLPVTTNMTWTVQFSGLGATDAVGLDVYSPATVGSGFSDYWQLSGTTWTLMTNAAGPISFGAKMQAAVPEPSSLVLGLLSGVGMMVGLRRVRRKL